MILKVSATLACESPCLQQTRVPGRTSSKAHVKRPWAALRAEGLPGQRKGRESLLPDFQRRMKDCPDWQWVTEGSAESLKGNQRPDYTSQLNKTEEVNTESGLDNQQPCLKKLNLDLPSTLPCAYKAKNMAYCSHK